MWLFKCFAQKLCLNYPQCNFSWFILLHAVRWGWFHFAESSDQVRYFVLFPPFLCRRPWSAFLQLQEVLWLCPFLPRNVGASGAAALLFCLPAALQSPGEADQQGSFQLACTMLCCDARERFGAPWCSTPKSRLILWSFRWKQSREAFVHLLHVVFY